MTSNENIYRDEGDNSDLYVVSVDSRGKSPSDLDCYKECTCSKSFMQEHIVDNPNHVCVASQVAALCGLDLHLYFYDHLKDPVLPSSDDSSVEREINAVATLLTFNPEDGHTQHKIYGKAYVVWDKGVSPLSKRQCWGLNELIMQAREHYHEITSDHGENTHHYNAKMELLRWCQQYRVGKWTPHTIYESRHEHDHHHHHRHHAHSKEHRQHLHHRHRHLDRELSGISDQATCHHGCTHIHHNGHHTCCHTNEHLEDSDEEHPQKVDRTHVVVEDEPHNTRKLDSELFVYI